MEKQIHIFNGDSLLQQTHNLFDGKKIVCRECMIEGNVNGKTLNELFNNRAAHIHEVYNISHSEYFAKTKNELLQIQDLPAESEINLWFEDDLFCQTNLWFVAHLLKEFKIINPMFIVRPLKGNEYNFGKMNADELRSSFYNRTEIKLDILNELQKLWHAYQQNDTTKMLGIAQTLHPLFPFIGPAVYAQIAKYLGMPKKALKKIIIDLNTKEFTPIFKEFCKREAIYGFGDTQVKRMFDEIMKEPNEE